VSRAAGVLAAVALVARAAAAQQVTVTVGPQFALESYTEVGAALQYQGVGVGGGLTARAGRFSGDAVVTRATLNPTSGNSSLQSFKATQVDVWVAYDVAPYASVEVGITHRSIAPDFAAQSVGAVRVGARAFSDLGPGATLAFHADYLAAPQFSGGGRAPISLDLGFTLDVRLAGRLHGTAAYAFQRVDRKTNPGSTGEIDAPIQESLGRLGLALAF
jgi:hypothetical protein